MKISYNWLKQYLNLDLEVTKVGEILTDIGLEVEGIDKFSSIKGGLKGIIIGEVIEKYKHPNADKLNLTKVDVGQGEALQIVCGAPNVDVGQKVPVASVGTILYNENSEIKIKKGKIRGEYSYGMICSEKELGLGSDDSGIMVLSENVINGTLGSEYFEIEEDFIFEIGLTPNRTDSMSHLGVARDLRAALNYQGSNLTICLPKVDDVSLSFEKPLDIEIEDYNLCPRYSGVSISNITVEPSPKWLKNRLLSIGLIPINNIVDITNYVLHETGQPLHAFDLEKIKGNKIIVSKANKKINFTTLDEIDREISPNDLLINNASEPMCIAGVLGGLKHGVSKSTSSIFLESAYFNPVSIRKTSKFHSLNTDASFRYERGCDPNITVYALKRAVKLIEEICSGKVSSKLIDIYPNKISGSNISLKFDKINNTIGAEIKQKTVLSILKDLDIEILDYDRETVNLIVPAYRHDVTRDIDVIEEVLRIYGYNNIPLPKYLKTSITDDLDLNLEDIDKISNLLVNNGFSEVMNNSLINNESIKKIKDLKAENNIKILNPLSNELNILRRTLLINFLQNISFNHNRKSFDLKLFEFGKTYMLNDNKYIESNRLFVSVTGKINQENWNKSSASVDIFYLKEKIEHIFNRLGVKSLSLSDYSDDSISEGLEYSDNNLTVARLGKVHKEICSSFKIKKDIYVADINWDLLISYSKNNSVSFKEISKFPVVRRDLALLINDDVSYSELMSTINSVNSKIIQSVNLFDVYKDNKIAKDKKSYALSITFSDPNKTLKDSYIDKEVRKILLVLEKNFSAEIRK